jgi:hypothetical protein
MTLDNVFYRNPVILNPYSQVAAMHIKKEI